MMRTASRLLVALVVLLSLSALAAFQYLRAVEDVPAQSRVLSAQRVPGEAPSLAWPRGAAAAVSVDGLGSLGSSADASPRPMASVAKVMTALVVFEGHPLVDEQTGELVTVTAADVQNYRANLAEGQSVVKVSEGETLSELQLLEGLLIPSGNNLADVIARWDSGTLATFVAKMNLKAGSLGMKHTHFADASGFSEQTVATAADLVLAGEALMKIPVLARIVALPQVELPVVGVVYNVNYALGREGLIGIKTGSAPKAGACFLFAATRSINDRPVMIVGAVMGLPTLDDAFDASQRLIAAVIPGLSVLRAVSAAQTVGVYRAPWGSRTRIVSVKDVDVLAWPGLVVNRRLKVAPARAPVGDGTQVGEIEVWVGSGPHRVASVTTDGPFFAPGRFWRLTRPISDSS